MTATQDDMIAELQNTIGALQVRLDAALVQRDNAYDERIKHQAATIDVLKAMSASPGDTEAVFDLIVRRARELCDGSGAGLLEFEGELVHYLALASARIRLQRAYAPLSDAPRAQFDRLPGDLGQANHSHSRYGSRTGQLQAARNLVKIEIVAPADARPHGDRRFVLGLQ